MFAVPDMPVQAAARLRTCAFPVRLAEVKTGGLLQSSGLYR
jgi:hypothetical protein